MDAKIMRKQWLKGDFKRLEKDVKPENVKVLEGINYQGDDDNQHTLDLVYPQNYDGKLPIIMHIHGGGFFSGDREIYDNYCRRLASYGFVVANCNYGLTPEHPFPEGIKDLVKAAQFLKDNTEKYDLDIENFFVYGDSAGGNLSVMMGLFSSNQEFANLYDLTFPIKVKAVGTSCGVYTMDITKLSDTSLLKAYFKKSKKEIMKEIYKLDLFSNMSKEFSPTYVTSCKDDFLYEDNIKLVSKLKELGIENDSLIYDNDEKTNPLGHVFNYRWIRDDGTPMPEARETTEKMVEFFKKYIKK